MNMPLGVQKKKKKSLLAEVIRANQETRRFLNLQTPTVWLQEGILPNAKFFASHSVCLLAD